MWFIVRHSVNHASIHTKMKVFLLTDGHKLTATKINNVSHTQTEIAY